MDTNLYRVSKVCWAVMSQHNAEAQVFKTIEDAAMYLEDIGICDEDIDSALVDMLANTTTRATFDTSNGKFISSDNTRLNELLGIA